MQDSIHNYRRCWFIKNKNKNYSRLKKTKTRPTYSKPKEREDHIEDTEKGSYKIFLVIRDCLRMKTKKMCINKYIVSKFRALIALDTPSH